MSHRASHQTNDWSQVADSADRRRVQNRIAQRQYRKKLKKRLEEADSIIASGSHLRHGLRLAKPHAPHDPSFPKSCVKTDTTDLHRDQGIRPQDSSVAPVQQQCKEEPLDALLPAAHSLLPTSGGIAGGTAQHTDPFLPPFCPWTAVAVGLATPLAVEYLPSNICYINDGGSPFDQGYLAMNGTWVAAQHRCL